MTELARPEPFEKLSIFFPMWNEEEYIQRALSASQEVCDELIESGEIKDYELIVVNDASTDRTGEIADQIASVDPRVRVVHHPVNRKLGGSIKSGLAAASGDVILYTDADLPFEMLELVRAIRILRIYEADMICAYRHDRTSEGPKRAVYSWFYNWLVQLSLGLNVRDVNFAFKLMRKEVRDSVNLQSEGSFIDAELVARASRMGFQIMQIGVDYFPRTRGTSTLSSPAVIVKILREMRALRSSLKAVTPADRTPPVES